MHLQCVRELQQRGNLAASIKLQQVLRVDELTSSSSLLLSCLPCSLPQMCERAHCGLLDHELENILH
jgi:hypothetical protein